METAAFVLLIIVSTVLAIFLLTLIIAAVYFIKFLRKADELADNVGSAATAFKRSVAAVPILRLIANIATKKRR